MEHTFLIQYGGDIYFLGLTWDTLTFLTQHMTYLSV